MQFFSPIHFFLGVEYFLLLAYCQRITGANLATAARGREFFFVYVKKSQYLCRRKNRQTMKITKKISTALRRIARLPKEDRERILSSTDDELPEVLMELGISLPSSSWVLRVLKVLLYAAGLLLAGFGTAEAATMAHFINH